VRHLLDVNYLVSEFMYQRRISVYEDVSLMVS